MNNCPFATIENTINAFVAGTSPIHKCFGIKAKEPYISGLSDIIIAFQSQLRQLLPDLGAVYMGFNYPQQRLQDFIATRYWNNPNKTGHVDWFKVTTVELLKRRNKPSQPCSTKWKEFDDWILKEHIKNTSCRAPYMKAYEDFPICDTQTKMEESVFFWMESTYPSPCEGASNIGYTFSTVQNSIHDPSLLILLVSYTNKIKIITQSRLIDGQALVGYIGGYVGLFLGI